MALSLEGIRPDVYLDSIQTIAFVYRFKTGTSNLSATKLKAYILQVYILCMLMYLKLYDSCRVYKAMLKVTTASILQYNYIFHKMEVQTSIVLAILMNLALASSEPCNSWFIEEADECKCGVQIRSLLECSQIYKKIDIRDSYCLTYYNTTELEYFGACPYNTKSANFGFNTISKTVTELDEIMCGPLKRTGLLCSQCRSGLGPAVFSYYRECKECIAWPFGWIVFFVRLIVPQTLFCIVVMVFQINITAPTLNGFVVAAQLISSMLNNNPFLLPVKGNSYSLTKFVVDFYGIFNLDFFVYLLPSFCIHKDMSVHTVIILEYFTALYPALFTAVVYVCITLHDKGYQIVIACWKPFHKCLARFRRSWNPKGSILSSFSTFLILSYCKISSTSVQLIQPVKVWDKYGNVTYRMYFDATYDVHKNGIYVWYIVLASTVLITMVLLPAFFTLFYQNKLFQRCLFLCRLKLQMIHELVCIAQGCFKNGTTLGTRDYRWFAGFYLFLRILFIFFLIQNISHLVCVIIFSVTAVMVAGLRPYKENRYNVGDTVLWLMATVGVSWFNYNRAYNIRWTGIVETFGSFPFLYISFCICWKAINSIAERIQKLRAKRSKPVEDKKNVENALPHRLLEPSEYAPLLQTKPLHIQVTIP